MPRIYVTATPKWNRRAAMRGEGTQPDRTAVQPLHAVLMPSTCDAFICKPSTVKMHGPRPLCCLSASGTKSKEETCATSVIGHIRKPYTVQSAWAVQYRNGSKRHRRALDLPLWRIGRPLCVLTCDAVKCLRHLPELPAERSIGVSRGRLNFRKGHA